MLHYFLVVLVYAGFIGIVYAYENKSGIGSGISLSVPFSFYIMYLVIPGMMLGAKNPDIMTYTVLVTALIINVLL